MRENRTPNHICKYSKCNLGTDANGNRCRKHYYACPDCDRLHSWRAVACCPEHYAAYMNEVAAARSKPKAAVKSEPASQPESADIPEEAPSCAEAENPPDEEAETSPVSARKRSRQRAAGVTNTEQAD